MKTRFICLFTIIVFSITNCYSTEFPLSTTTYDACGFAGFKTSNGIMCGDPGYSDSITVHEVDSMSFEIKAKGSSCTINLFSITLDSIPVSFVVYQHSNYYFKGGMLARPGKYKIHFNVYYVPVLFSFDIHLKSLVGLNENDVNNNIKIYPSPARSLLNITSDNEQLELITISDPCGKVTRYSVSGKEVRLPLDDLPAGIYTVRAATLSGRASIKKISVISP